MPVSESVIGNLGVARDQVAAVAELIVGMSKEDTISCVRCGVCEEWK